MHSITAPLLKPANLLTTTEWECVKAECHAHATCFPNPFFVITTFTLLHCYYDGGCSSNDQLSFNTIIMSRPNSPSYTT